MAKLNKITKIYDILRGKFISSVKIRVRAECSDRRQGCIKSPACTGWQSLHEETGETFNWNSYSLMHQRVSQAQDIKEQESGMEEKSNSQVLVLLKYLLTQWLNFAGIPPTEQAGGSSQKYSVTWFLRAAAWFFNAFSRKTFFPTYHN